MYTHRRGVSQGPSRFGRGPATAFGRPVAQGVPTAIGRPGASYAAGPFVGGGFAPTMGYHPSLGFDIATGIMIGHMLRTPHHHRPPPLLHGGRGGGAAGTAAVAGYLPAPPASVRDGAYYHGKGALHAGSVIACFIT